MSVRCYYSGVESPQHWQQCLDRGVRNVLMSYYQFGKRAPDLVKKRKKANPHVRFMIDSGAHTFIHEYQKFIGWTRQMFDDYVRGYAQWINDNRDYIHSVVEFDIDYCLNMVLAKSQSSGIGLSIVEGWQRQYFHPLEQRGVEVVYVWHTERGVEGWEDMCARYSYVGLPGELSKEKDFNKFISVAKRYNTRIHGFAATKQLDFSDVEWFSIDSITWKTGEMFGQMIVWDESAQRLTYVDDKKERFKYRALIKARGFDDDAIVNDRNYKEVTRFSLDSMRRMEEFYARKYSKRQFYYETRLAPPKVVQCFPKFSKYLERKWNLFKPAEKFKQHVNASQEDVRTYLTALAAAQYGDKDAILNNKKGMEFLRAYFPALIDPLVSDLRVLQKELAMYTSPPNPPALARTQPGHYESTNNPPRMRDQQMRDEVMVEAQETSIPIPPELMAEL